MSMQDATNYNYNRNHKDGLFLADLLRGHRAEVTNMLFKEFDIDAHIASEKESSYEEGLAKGRKSGLAEGRRAEQENTKREQKRADRFLHALIHSYAEQGKSVEEIASLCEQSVEFVQEVLTK